jgi:[protein-PII] uridylyltransferase
MTTAEKRRFEERQAGLAGIRERFLAGGHPAPVLEGVARVAEAVVRAAYAEFLAPAWPHGLALVAVGGFGRRELFPFSDVDLLLLVEKGPGSGPQKDGLSAFLRFLWDNGLRLSHSVRTPEECCALDRRNIELAISLLDQRYLCGDRERHAELARRLPQLRQGRAAELARHLSRLARARHARYQDTLYHLEPNIKEGPGGLRDIHLVRWLEGLGVIPQAERPTNAATPHSALRTPHLEEAHRFVQSLRCFLHYRDGRDQNVLAFDAQQDVVGPPFHAAEPSSWMRQYFRHARDVYRAAKRALEAAETRPNSLLGEFRHWRARLSNPEFTLLNERLYLRSPQHLAAEPDMLFRLFQFVGRHGARPAAETDRRIAEALPAFISFCAERPLWPALSELLSLPHTGLALECMHETGVLRAVLPEWGEIECLVVRDFHHRYTVDEHSLVAIRNLFALQHSGDTRLRGLMEEVEDLSLLALALLFHDAGKGGAPESGAPDSGAQGHVPGSLEAAARAMQRIGVPVSERAEVSSLIADHLLLSEVMSSRDPDDPRTARELAERVGTVERLQRLTLLTYADVSAVNPTAMTPWRLEQLWDLYLRAWHELTHQLDTNRTHAAPAVPPEKAAFLDGFPVRYLRVHSEAEVEAQFQLWQQAGARGAAARIEKRQAGYLATVITRDRPSLLAAIAGAISSFGMNIIKAEAFANRQGWILDSFLFADPGRTLELNPDETGRMETAIEQVILGKMDAEVLLEKRPARRPNGVGRLRPAVTFDTAASLTSTLVEIVAEDRPGLLHDLARAISLAGCNIEVVLVDTKAHKALDVFYVTRDGAKLTPEQQSKLQVQLLEACRS